VGIILVWQKRFFSEEILPGKKQEETESGENIAESDVKSSSENPENPEEPLAGSTANPASD
jgi:hypothetical protein